MNIDMAMRRGIRRCIPISIDGRNRCFIHTADERSGSRVEYQEYRDSDCGWIHVTVKDVCVATVHLTNLSRESRRLSGCVEVRDVSKKMYQNRVQSVLDLFFPGKYIELESGMVCPFGMVEI